MKRLHGAIHKAPADPLRARLERFIRELAAPQRKTYVWAQHDDREWLSHLALLFLHDTGSVSPSVLAEVAHNVPKGNPLYLIH